MIEIICDNEGTIWGSTEMRYGPFKMLPSLKFELLESDIKKGFSENMIVLESGCGGGMYIEELSKSMNNNKYIGTDFSRSAIKDVSKENTKVKYFISDSMIMPVKDNSVDVLLILDIVEHVDKPENVFAEAKRILKRDGIMHLNIPVEANKATIFWLLGKIFRKNFQKKYSGHIHSYSLNEVENLLDKYQFKVADINYYYHFIGQLTQFILYFAKYLKEVLSKKESSLGATGIDKGFIAGLKDEYYESKFLKIFSFMSSCTSARIVKISSYNNKGDVDE